MGIIKKLIGRFWHTGILFVVGFVLIIFVALGFLYFQHRAEQRDLEEQIAQLTIIVIRPLPSVEKLQAEYDEVSDNLTPWTVKAALDEILTIAEKSGIEVDPDAGKFIIPPGSSREEEIGRGSYQVLSFRSILVQGEYDDVMAFISDLDFGKTLETMVLKKVDIKQTELKLKVGEETRREEFRKMSFVVIDMMTDNGLLEIPAPLDYAGGIATNDMGSTSTKGFPDNTTTADDRDYTGTDTPRDGYVLYQHDKISTDNTSQFGTVDYITVPITTYYYTCEADGTLRQFDGSDVATAIEYPNDEWEARRTELYNVSLTVGEMMTDNGLLEIPAPLDYTGGIATNLMGDDPDTEETMEGFPDNTTMAIDKGYTGTDKPRGGYVLYNHDKISTDNTTQFETVSYIILPTTKYYYTCEADGTVRQFDSPDVATAEEYLGIETVAVLEVSIYSKPLEGE